MAELDIPESWAECQLGDVAAWGSGGTPSRSQKENFNGKISWLKTGDLTDSLIADTQEYITELGLSKISGGIFPENTVVMAMYGATIGKLGLLSKPCATNQACANAKCLPQVYPWFLFFWLKFRRNLFIELGRGGGQPNISRELICRQPMVLPPLVEQKRIVAKIEATSQRIDAIEKAVADAEELLRKYRESLLAKAFRGELVPQDPNDEPASKLLERIRAELDKQQNGKKKRGSDLPPISEDEIPFEIPSSWKWLRLGEILSIKHGFAFDGANFAEKGEKILITPGNFLSMGGFRTQGIKTKYYDGEVNDEYVFRGGELIVAMTDLTQKPPGILGSAAFIPEDGNSYLHNQRIGLIMLDHDELLSIQYLAYYFNYQLFRFMVHRSSTGSTVRHTSPSKIYEIPFPLPPMREQKKIATTIKSMLGMMLKLTNQFGPLEHAGIRFREAILSSAFSGRLVPQDPSEGTGHELLADIIAANKVDNNESKHQSKRGRTSRL